MFKENLCFDFSWFVEDSAFPLTKLSQRRMSERTQDRKKNSFYWLAKISICYKNQVFQCNKTFRTSQPI